MEAHWERDVLTARAEADGGAQRDGEEDRGRGVEEDGLGDGDARNKGRHPAGLWGRCARATTPCFVYEWRINGRGQGAGGPSGWWWWRALKRGSEKVRVAGVAEL